MTSPLYVNNDQIIKSNILLASISVFVSLFSILVKKHYIHLNLE